MQASAGVNVLEYREGEELAQNKLLYKFVIQEV